VFTQLSVLDLSLPTQSTGALEQLSADKLNLEIVIRADAIGSTASAADPEHSEAQTGHYDIAASARWRA
jgi:hypothetical protein